MRAAVTCILPAPWLQRTSCSTRARWRGSSATQRAPARAQSTSFYSELLSAASSFQWSATGTHVVTRDYMRACLWDVRSERTPLRTFQIHEHLWDYLAEIYENDSIFDRLGCAVSPSGSHIAAGTYGELAVYAAASETFTLLKSSGSPIAVNVREPAGSIAHAFLPSCARQPWHGRVVLSYSHGAAAAEHVACLSRRVRTVRRVRGVPRCQPLRPSCARRARARGETRTRPTSSGRSRTSRGTRRGRSSSRRPSTASTRIAPG